MVTSVIFIVKFLCKAVSGVINRWIALTIAYYNFLYIFMVGRGTGITSL